MNNTNEKQKVEFKAIIPLFEHKKGKISIDLAPENVKEFVSAVTKMAQVDESMVVMGVLSILSTVLSSHFNVQCKKDWQESINIYLMIFLPPGSSKSVVLKHLLEPIKQWEKEARTKIAPIIKRQKSEAETKRLVIDKMRKDCCQSSKEERDHKIEEIIDMGKSLPEIERLPKLFTNNVTPESLITELSENNNKMAIISDEGGVFENLSGLYSNGRANVDVLTKGIEGGDIRVKRNDFDIELNPYLTLFFMVQPVVLENMKNKNIFRGIGFFERILYLFPENYVGSRKFNNYSIPEDISNNYSNLIKDLIEYISVLEQQETLNLSTDAKVIFQVFWEEIEIKLKDGGKLDNIRGWAGKLCGFALRISGLIELCEDKCCREISVCSMRKAVEICRRLIPHAEESIGYLETDQSTINANKILKWIQNDPHINEVFTQTNVVYRFRNSKIKGDELNDALNLLIEHNYLVRSCSLPTSESKKPTTYYHINPQIKNE